MTLFYSFAKEDQDEAITALARLKAIGYSCQKIDTLPCDSSEVILAFFSSKTDIVSFWKAFPWLKEQQEFSSCPYLHVMPFFLYHGQKEDPEEAFNGPAGTLYESVFSGEFKPFGWDLDSPCPEKEFQRVLEDYEE